MPILTFLLEKCSKDIVLDVKRLMEEDKSLFLVSKDSDFKKIHNFEFLGAAVVSVHPRLKNANLILLHVSLHVETDGFFGFEGYDDWRQVTSEVTLDYYLTFQDASYVFIFLDARAGIKDNYDGRNSLRQDLIPYISSERYDDEARQFLQDIYPEALDTPMPIDVFDLANRLDLQARPYDFSECNQVLGRTYFIDLKLSN